MSRLLSRPDYRRFWLASTVSAFGTEVTTLALSILAVSVMRVSAPEAGLINAARWLPYLLLGVVAGLAVDRYRRRPILVGTDLGKGLVLLAIPGLYAADLLTPLSLALVVAAFGTLSLFFDAAEQAFVPRLVPPRELTAAYARLDQAGAVAGAGGPVLAGALIRLVGAPLAIVADALSYLASGLLLARMTTPESPPAGRRHWRSEMVEGLRWVYRHRTLSRLAISDHIWFLFNSMLATVFLFWAQRTLGWDAVRLGLCFAAAGIGAVLGGALAGWLGGRFGPTRTITVCRLAHALPWLAVPVVGGGTLLPAVLFAQFGYWVLLGIDGPQEMSYRNSVTPHRLQGRMNTTIRSINRGAVAAGAPLGGVLFEAFGYRIALWSAIIGLTVATTPLLGKPFRMAGPAAALDPATNAAVT
jgi:predicted MFS family arabinose efflux permease